MSAGRFWSSGHQFVASGLRHTGHQSPHTEHWLEPGADLFGAVCPDEPLFRMLWGF